MKRLKKIIFLTAVCTATIPGNITAAQQAVNASVDGKDGQSAEYNIDNTIVTATRSKKKNIEVPESVEVITAEQIKNSGATNAAEALAKVNGFTYKSFGPAGASRGAMNNELIIRGVGNGTLVLLNGNPISWRGKYDIDEIPAESIERIEIVKGSGSILYGSEAMGGVVNIITKKTAQNTVTAGIGNYGRKFYNINAGTDKITINYNRDKWGTVSDLSEKYINLHKLKGIAQTDVKDVQKESAAVNYKINNNWNAFYGYYHTKAIYDYFMSSVDESTEGITSGMTYNIHKAVTTQRIGQLSYHDNNVKGNFYYNTGIIKYSGPTFIDRMGNQVNDFYNTRERNTSYGIDGQRTWHIGEKTNIISGLDLQREKYEPLLTGHGESGRNRSRNNWGVFTQWEQQFDKKNTGTIGMRETWTTDADNDQNYSNFSMAGSILHKMDNENNIYLNINQSFIMPTFAQMYGSSDKAVPNPGLKPQTGINYELGWKKNSGRHNWKAAVFHTVIKDNITAKLNNAKTEYTYLNEDFRNTGIELSCDIADKADNFTYKWGITYQNPRVKSTNKDYWDEKYGRLQLMSGLTYKYRKLNSTISASYLCDRVEALDNEHSTKVKPYLLTTWNTIYQPDANNEIALTIDNLLDRRDNVMQSSTNYNIITPVNYLLTFTHKF
ncbi:TonB-dependent receptor plug domain-containing protein [Pectinatus sottacetonis]|uniref:TonB-dependent receptor plug domain-containing protein n=1 Tax=Pectinatus sottacetonis TaxID=1002795 RepID=UPI001E406599|nr:TonB-dependent receptor [Pectinatus sottacetonis]